MRWQNTVTLAAILARKKGFFETERLQELAHIIIDDVCPSRP